MQRDHPREQPGRALRLVMLLGITAFYSSFVLAFARAFHSWWPLWLFGYLFVCRFVYLVVPGDTGCKLAGATKIWIASALAYLGAVFLTLFLPLPRLGITPDVIAAMGMSKNMGGVWVREPWIVLAFGAIYLAAQAVVQYRFAPDRRAAARGAPLARPWQTGCSGRDRRRVGRNCADSA